MENVNNLYAMSDAALLSVIGDFIRARRLDQNKTQGEIAEAAGLNRTTLSQIENGAGGTMVSLIQILRALGQLHLLSEFQAKRQISPLELAKLEQAQRLRSRHKNKGDSRPQSDW